jgi:regulator of nucleoside diphosphate kinase
MLGLPQGGRIGFIRRSALREERTMHINQATIAIAADDHSRLMLRAHCHAQEDPRDTERLLRKLRSATLFAPEELPDDVVSLDTFVTYRMDGERSARRALILPEDWMWPYAEISVLTSLGTDLLGQRVGERIPVDFQEPGQPRWVQIESVEPRLQSGIVSLGPIMSASGEAGAAAR